MGFKQLDKMTAEDWDLMTRLEEDDIGWNLTHNSDDPTPIYATWVRGLNPTDICKWKPGIIHQMFIGFG